MPAKSQPRRRLGHAVGQPLSSRTARPSRLLRDPSARGARSSLPREAATEGLPANGVRSGPAMPPRLAVGETIVLRTLPLHRC